MWKRTDRSLPSTPPTRWARTSRRRGSKRLMTPSMMRPTSERSASVLALDGGEVGHAVGDDGIAHLSEGLDGAAGRPARVQQVFEVAAHGVDHLLQVEAVAGGTAGRVRLGRQAVEDRRGEPLVGVEA